MVNVAEGLQVTTALSPEQVEAARKWVIEALTAYERKDPNFVSRIFLEGGMMESPGLGNVVGVRDLQDYFAWEFRATTAFEMRIKTLHITKTQIIIEVEGAATFAKGDPMKSPWVFTIDKELNAPKMTKLRVEGELLPMFTRFCEFAGPAPGLV